MEGQLGFDLDVPTVEPAAGPVRGKAPTPRPAPRRTISASAIAQALGRPEPTPEQVAVIEAPLEPLLVVAGAGSGKTETMAARVVWLVANGLVQPDEVLGLTFTRKAAGELAERIRARLRALHRKGLTPQALPVTVSTYHSYAAAVLGDHSLRLGIEPGARLLGEAGSWQLVDELVERWDGDMTGVDSARATVVDAVLGLAGEIAEHLLDPEGIDALAEAAIEQVQELPKNVGDAVPGKPKTDVKQVVQRMQARRALVPLVAAYQRRKRELEVLDFGDQVALAAQLARTVPEVGEVERQRFRVVLLDEYQDTSHAQVVLLQELFGGGHPVIAVGDPHQSIYAWRGASAGNLQRFGLDFPAADGGRAATRHLSTSWRNDLAILQVANELAAPLRHTPIWSDPDLSVDVQPLAARPDAGPGRVRLEWHATLEDEARAIADIAEFAWHDTESGNDRPSVAVLCRARAQFPLIEAALRGRGLPVEVIGLGGLLHVPEIADLRAALEVVHDPTRGDALMRLLTGPAWRIGPRDLDGLGAWARELAATWRGAGEEGRVRPPADSGLKSATIQVDAVDEVSVVDAIDALPEPDWEGTQGQGISAEGRRRLERLAAVLRGLRSRLALPLPDLVLEAERALLLDVEVAAQPNRSPAAARAHLDAFADVAAQFADSGDRPTLGTFLGWLTAAEDRERGLDTGVVEQHEDAIQLLTVHGSKGLEWDVVAVCGLVEGTFPAGHAGRAPKRSKGWLGDIGAVPFPLRGDAGGLPQWDFRAATTQDELDVELKRFMDYCGEHEVAEERRLAYVAATRAKDSLLLTGAIWGDGSTPREPSRFLVEVRELLRRAEGGLLPGAGEAATTRERIAVGLWTDQPDEGAENPRAVEGRMAVWPDPLGERREVVEDGAELVRLAIEALSGERRRLYGTRQFIAEDGRGPGGAEGPDRLGGGDGRGGLGADGPGGLGADGPDDLTGADGPGGLDADGSYGLGADGLGGLGADGPVGSGGPGAGSQGADRGLSGATAGPGQEIPETSAQGGEREGVAAQAEQAALEDGSAVEVDASEMGMSEVQVTEFGVTEVGWAPDDDWMPLDEWAPDGEFEPPPDDLGGERTAPGAGVAGVPGVPADRSARENAYERAGTPLNPADDSHAFGLLAPQTTEEAAWAREVDVLLAERDAAASGELTVRLPAHLSASRAVALAADRQGLAERLRRPMPAQPSPQARRGSAFHAWLERRFGAAALVDIDDLPGAGDDHEDLRLETLQQNFLASEWAERTAEAVEVSIETPVAGVALRGRIDAVFRRPDGMWDVVDWKTGRPPTREQMPALSVQLAVYRLAWSRLQGIPVEQVSAAFFYASVGRTVRPVDILDEAALEELLTV
ncbi:ATP-dependent helicase [Kineosporia rhizophila]|uniref:ATP-dependent helicase n=1 Tax=Kineosporia rhizophila TaxID=84633 RepID=UPI001E4AEBC6|nr:ATP-dependent DNA helicase [Kineosporia rhizophila]MCE0534907.1 ATP-dependent helicase [Kineosporia rhizophila]